MNVLRVRMWNSDKDNPQLRFALGIVFVMLAVGLFSLAFRARNIVMELPLTEDGYYSLAIARNIALGRGITIDGTTWTNGFQPLFTFAIVPFYALTNGDRYETLRYVIALHWIINVMTALLLGVIVETFLTSQGRQNRGGLAYWFTAILWIGSRYVMLNSYNGLETGCTLLFYTIAWRMYQQGWTKGWRFDVLGIVLGFLVLSRIDAVLFVALFATRELLRKEHSIKSRCTRFIRISAIPFIVSLPWWIYNVTIFGSFLPSSATAQAGPFTTSRLYPMFENILQVGAPYLQIRWIQGYIQTSLQLIVVIVLVVVFYRLFVRQGRDDDSLYFAYTLFFSSMLLGGYYLFYSGAVHFYGRYLSPIMLLSIPMTAICLTLVRRYANMAYIASIVPLFGIAIASIIGWQAQVGVSRSPFYTNQLQLIAYYVPTDELVGAGQSGTIGYFRDKVINLDGKVNASALLYKTNMWKYLEQQNIVWYCDWDSTFLGADPMANGWKTVATKGPFTLYHRQPKTAFP